MPLRPESTSVQFGHEEEAEESLFLIHDLLCLPCEWWKYCPSGLIKFKNLAGYSSNYLLSFVGGILIGKEKKAFEMS